MAWTIEPNWQAGVKDQPTLTDFNQLFRDNGNYLLGGRPNASDLRDNNATYTTASTSFVDVDGGTPGVALSRQILVNSGKVMVVLGATMLGDGTAGGYRVSFDFTIDGTRYGNGWNGGPTLSDGLWGGLINAANNVLAFTISGMKYVSGLSTGVTHTFNLQYKTSVGTAKLCSGNGTAGNDFPVIFDVFEIG